MTENRHKSQLDLVLHIQHSAGIFAGIVRVIVRVVIINADSLARSIKRSEIAATGPRPRIVIHNEDEVVGTVVGERGG